jgi:hypothetical protein
MITYHFYVYIILVELGGLEMSRDFANQTSWLVFSVGILERSLILILSHLIHMFWVFVPRVPVLHVCFGVRNAEQSVEQS